jgi:hypothetical protein
MVFASTREIPASPPPGGTARQAVKREEGGTLSGKSDSPIVLRARESRVHGEGASKVTR